MIHQAMKEKYTEPTIVFAGTMWQVGMIKSLLKDAGIEAYIKDEIMGVMEPWLTASGGSGAIKVFVSSHDYDLAELIVEEYERKML